MKIDHFRIGNKIEEEDISIERVEITYSQTPDCSQEDHYEGQSIKFFTENGGGGPYVVLETKRWAVSELDDLVKLYEDFHKRAGIDE